MCCKIAPTLSFLNPGLVFKGGDSEPESCEFKSLEGKQIAQTKWQINLGKFVRVVEYDDFTVLFD